MKNKRGFELAISTLVVIVLALLILAALVVAFTMGFENFLGVIRGYFVSDISAVKQACENACISGLSYDFCCVEREMDFGQGKEKITCEEKRLNISCDLNCEGVC
ncbi:MAG: hypothetical protein AABX71_02865 [Nanoarchaeota archaeon]